MIHTHLIILNHSSRPAQFANEVVDSLLIDNFTVLRVPVRDVIAIACDCETCDFLCDWMTTQKIAFAEIIATTRELAA